MHTISSFSQKKNGSVVACIWTMNGNAKDILSTINLLMRIYMLLPSTHCIVIYVPEQVGSGQLADRKMTKITKIQLTFAQSCTLVYVCISVHCASRCNHIQLYANYIYRRAFKNIHNNSICTHVYTCALYQ